MRRYGPWRQFRCANSKHSNVKRSVRAATSHSVRSHRSKRSMRAVPIQSAASQTHAIKNANYSIHAKAKRPTLQTRCEGNYNSIHALALHQTQFKGSNNSIHAFTAQHTPFKNANYSIHAIAAHRTWQTRCEGSHNSIHAITAQQT